MAKFSYEVTIPNSGTYEVESDKELSDAEAYKFALAQATPSVQTSQPKPPKSGGLADLILGGAETALTLGTAATGGLFGTIGGAVTGAREEIKAGRFGTPAAARAISERAAAGAQQYTYMPRTEAGMEQVQAIGQVAGLLPPVLPGALPAGMLSQSVRQAAPIVSATALRGAEAVRQGTGQVVAAAKKTPTIVRESLGLDVAPTTQTTRGSAGAAATPMGLQREQTAESLGVKLTLGEKERDPSQLAFEKEAVKGPLGQPLITRAEQNNLSIMQRFDELLDETGADVAKSGDITLTGNKLIDALSSGYSGAKAKTKAAYERAKLQGELEVPTSITNVADYLNQNAPEATVAPILKVAKEKGLSLGIFKELEDGTLQAQPSTLADVELLRRSINKSIGIDPTNKNFGRELKESIDLSTEGLGGAAYKEARALRKQQAIKYEGRAIVANLLTKVRGRDDPKIEASQAFQKSILNSTPEEITFLRRVLFTSGKDGQQAFRELQGATVDYLRKEAVKSGRTDSQGRPVVDTGAVRKATEALDANGRLDIMLGKKGAQNIRDVNEVLSYINTVPPGTLINNSGTAATLMENLRNNFAVGGAEMALTGFFTGIPAPVLTSLRVGINQIKTNRQNAKLKARINQALNEAEKAQKP
jgi:lipoprotein-anchoring transpeptidase ErfK/SrfK